MDKPLMQDWIKVIYGYDAHNPAGQWLKRATQYNKMSPAAFKSLRAIALLLHAKGGSGAITTQMIAEKRGHGVCPKSVAQHLNSFVKQGLIEIEKGERRGAPASITMVDYSPDPEPTDELNMSHAID